MHVFHKQALSLSALSTGRGQAHLQACTCNTGSILQTGGVISGILGLSKKLDQALELLRDLNSGGPNGASVPDLALGAERSGFQGTPTRPWSGMAGVRQLPLQLSAAVGMRLSASLAVRV